MPDVEWNRVAWNEGWGNSGDEWSEAWGGASAQWHGSIYPRICNFLPAQRVLEIGPGRGRWSQFLLRHCTEYFGVDLSENCVASCRSRFAATSKAHFLATDGKSLQMVPDGSIDFVFSYDSLVHAELDVLQEYIWQIEQKLTATGIAFLHHSNAASDGIDRNQVEQNFRGRSVSASLVRQLIEDVNGWPLIQEEINWGGPSRIDCHTTFCKSTFKRSVFRSLQNDSFMAEADLVRAFQSPYRLIA